MSITIADIQTNFNTFIGDSTNDRVSAADRLQYITEGTIWLQEELKNDHQVKTFDLGYLDTVNYYEVTSVLADLLEGADLRRVVGQNIVTLTHRSSRELAEDIANPGEDESWSIERKNNRSFLVVSARPEFTATLLDSFNGSASRWAIGSQSGASGDFTALTNNSHVFSPQSEGGSLQLTYDQAAYFANFAAIKSNPGTFALDLSAFENVGVFLFDLRISAAIAALLSSVTIHYGTDGSNTWSSTTTTNIDGGAFASGWQTLAFPWATATKVGAAVSTSITSIDITFSFTGAEGTGNDIYIDNFRIAQPETLTFHYVSTLVGTNSGGTPIYAFTSTTDIPYFSGIYDAYRYAVAHQAASFCFDALRLKDDAVKEEQRAVLALTRARNIFPSSITKEVKSFKVAGVSFNRGHRAWQDDDSHRL